MKVLSLRYERKDTLWPRIFLVRNKSKLSMKIGCREDNPKLRTCLVGASHCQGPRGDFSESFIRDKSLKSTWYLLAAMISWN
jgi:hypothetical protein